MAKIMTLGDRVEDIFILEGEVLSHVRGQLQFERHVLDALATPASQVSPPTLLPQ